MSLHYDGRLFYTTRGYQSRDYTSLTEGFDTKDLQEAKALIEGLVTRRQWAGNFYESFSASASEAVFFGFTDVFFLLGGSSESWDLESCVCTIYATPPIASMGSEGAHAGKIRERLHINSKFFL